MGEDEGTKAGGTGGALTLRIGAPDERGRPAADQIEEFARRVEALSDGELRIEPVWRVAGGRPFWDQRSARKVTSGELDMAVIPSRAWDTQGVTSLRALNAPFLITSDEVLEEVISGRLAGDLMAGLDEAGVVGLALFPEGLRHPFGLPKPLLGPDDYRGEVIRVPRSNTTEALFEALGATTNELRANADRHRGMESSYLSDTFGAATGNVTFYPKVNSLVANADVYDRLAEGQRDILRRAAAQTREWAIEETPTDAEAAAAFCGRGMTVVQASEADIAALERAAQPVYAELARDERTRAIIDAIRGLKRGMTIPATAPVICDHLDVFSDSDTADRRSSILNGVYRFEVTDEDLRAAGLTDPRDFDQNHGVVTYTFKDGRVCWEQRAPNFLANPADCYPYEIDGDLLIHNFLQGDQEVDRWRKTANGDLKLTVVSAPADPEIARAWVANTWERIGDAE
jgi:TRAP-type C4-dicarboxylate transport system substrate-binding protein